MSRRTAAPSPQPCDGPAPARGVGLQATRPAGFKGNKQSLPSKPCLTCGRSMSWRKCWARTWHEVRHCSQACRKTRGTGAGA